MLNIPMYMMSATLARHCSFNLLSMCIIVAVRQSFFPVSVALPTENYAISYENHLIRNLSSSLSENVGREIGWRGIETVQRDVELCLRSEKKNIILFHISFRFTFVPLLLRLMSVHTKINPVSSVHSGVINIFHAHMRTFYAKTSNTKPKMKNEKMMNVREDVQWKRVVQKHDKIHTKC